VLLASQPPIIAIPLAVAGGVLGGAIWGFIPGALKAFSGAHEVVTTIMLNWIVIYGGQYLYGLGGPLVDKSRSYACRPANTAPEAYPLVGPSQILSCTCWTALGNRPQSASRASCTSAVWDWRGPERPLPRTGAPRLHAAHGNVYVIKHGSEETVRVLVVDDVWVNILGGHFLDVSVSLNYTASRPMRGLLGNGNGDVQDDIATRDGISFIAKPE
jgi:hypothetical protein